MQGTSNFEKNGKKGKFKLKEECDKKRIKDKKARKAEKEKREKRQLKRTEIVNFGD